MAAGFRGVTAWSCQRTAGQNRATNPRVQGYWGMNLLKRIGLLLVLLVGLPVAWGNSSARDLAALVRAKEVLGLEGWTAALQIEAEQPGRSRDSVLVFEFAGALWLYRPIDGTRSLSRRWNQVAADRERLLELLLAEPLQTPVTAISEQERLWAVCWEPESRWWQGR